MSNNKYRVPKGTGVYPKDKNGRKVSSNMVTRCTWEFEGSSILKFKDILEAKEKIQGWSNSMIYVKLPYAKKGIAILGVNRTRIELLVD